MMVNPPIQVEPGYFEFRVNWDAADLMQMTGAQLDRLHAAVGAFVVIAAEVGDGYDKAAMPKAAAMVDGLAGGRQDTPGLAARQEPRGEA